MFLVLDWAYVRIQVKVISRIESIQQISSTP